MVNVRTPKHLYWGTRKENVEDAIRHGTWANRWDRLVEKIGVEAAREHMRSIGNPTKAGAGNKGKPKSEEHKRKISESNKGKLKGPQTLEVKLDSTFRKSELIA